MVRIGHSATVALLAALVAGAAVRGQAPATMPGDDDALAPVRQAVRETARAALAGSGGGAESAAAQATLCAVVALPAAELLRAVDLGDPEQLARAEALMAAVRTDARRVELLVRLSEGQRQAVRTLEAEHPKALADLLGEDPQAVVTALADLAMLQHPAVQPVLAWAVRHPQQDVRLAAIRAAMGVEDTRPVLHDALYGQLLRRQEQLHAASRRMGPVDSAWYDELELLVAALCRLDDPRVLDEAVRRLRTQKPWQTDGRAFVDAVASMRAPRLVPTLMDRIERGDTKGDWSMGWTVNAVTVTSEPVDAYIRIVLEQTGQDLDEYGLIELPLLLASGFPDDQTRQQALEKLKAWWAEHRHEYPAEPLPVDTRPGVRP